MTHFSSDEHIQQLASGYVLGNLSPEEAEEFQQLLAEHPEIIAEVSSLREVREMMSYALPEITPPPHLRSAILEAAQPRTQHKIRQRPQSPILWSAIVSSVAAVAAIAFGVDNYHLRKELKTAQVQLNQQKELIAKFGSQNSPVSTRILMNSEAFLQKNWDGIERILQDHLRSISQKQGSVDLPSSNPAEIMQHFQAQFPRTSDIPYVVKDGSKLIGGSFCNFGLSKTKGIRFTYKLKEGQMVSLYQIKSSNLPSFPKLNQDYLYVGQPHGPAILIWSDQQFLYALVGELSTEYLEKLAAQVKFI